MCSVGIPACHRQALPTSFVCGYQERSERKGLECRGKREGIVKEHLYVTRLAKGNLTSPFIAFTNQEEYLSKIGPFLTTCHFLFGHASI
jgi:hypothetical protein